MNDLSSSGNLPDRPLEQDLAEQNTMLYVNRGVAPAGIVPSRLTDGAAQSGKITVDYVGNAVATTTGSVPVEPDSLPLGFVWYLGATDRLTNLPVDVDAGLVGRSKATPSTEIYSANAGAAWTVSSLTVYVTSFNSGYPNGLRAHFYYVFFYDDLQVRSLGL